jgi:hypothetical protein
MKSHKLVTAASADHATQEVPDSAAPSHSVSRTQLHSDTKGRIAVAWGDRSVALEAAAIERWENEGGLVNGPDDVASVATGSGQVEKP